MQGPPPGGTNMEELLKGIPPNVAITTITEQQPGERGVERGLRADSWSLGTVSVPVRLSPLDRPSRHLSGDSGLSVQHQPPFSRAGRHQSGEQVRPGEERRDFSLPVQMAARRPSGDSSLQRFSLGGGGGEQLQLQPGTFTVVSQESSGGQTIARSSVGTPVVR